MPLNKPGQILAVGWEPRSRGSNHSSSGDNTVIGSWFHVIIGLNFEPYLGPIKLVILGAGSCQDQHQIHCSGPAPTKTCWLLILSYFDFPLWQLIRGIQGESYNRKKFSSKNTIQLYEFNIKKQTIQRYNALVIF